MPSDIIKKRKCHIERVFQRKIFGKLIYISPITNLQAKNI